MEVDDNVLAFEGKKVVFTQYEVFIYDKSTHIHTSVNSKKMKMDLQKFFLCSVLLSCHFSITKKGQNELHIYTCVKGTMIYYVCMYVCWHFT